VSQDQILKQIKRGKGEKCVSDQGLETDKEGERRKMCLKTGS
jgi:hypothetical protein